VQLLIASGVWEAGLTIILIEDILVYVRLPQSDPIFNMGVDVMRPAYNFELKYMVTMLNRED
jgi:hypothetical protein